MPKRSCPFPPQSTNLLKMHIDMRDVGKEDYKREVYEKTRGLMMRGALQAARCNKQERSDPPSVVCKGKKILGPVFSKKSQQGQCTNCRMSFAHQKETVSCEFCERRICKNCCRLCISCEKNFCHVCSVVNYEMRDEREFCLTCSNE